MSEPIGEDQNGRPLYYLMPRPDGHTECLGCAKCLSYDDPDNVRFVVWGTDDPDNVRFVVWGTDDAGRVVKMRVVLDGKPMPKGSLGEALENGDVEGLRKFLASLKGLKPRDAQEIVDEWRTLRSTGKLPS